MPALVTFAAIIGLALATILAAPLEARAKDWPHIRIGSEGGHPPFNMIDEMTRFQGFEVDIARAVCRHANATCEFVRQDFAGLIPALIAGRYDAVFSSLSITEERKVFVAFSDKYYETLSMFVANRRRAGFSTDPEAMRGMSVGAKAGSTNAAFLDAVYAPHGVRVKRFVTHDEARLELARGQVDAVLGDKTALLHWLEKARDGACCEIVGADVFDHRIMGDGIGAAVRKSDPELKALIDRGIAQIRADGEYDAIRRRYFAFDPY